MPQADNISDIWYVTAACMRRHAQIIPNRISAGREFLRGSRSLCRQKQVLRKVQEEINECEI